MTAPSLGSAGSVSAARTNRGTRQSRTPACTAQAPCRRRFRKLNMKALGIAASLTCAWENAPGISADEVAAMRANYAGNVSLIDDQIGDILHVVERRGELDNTVVVFSSDHGELNGDCGLIYKETFLNGAVRVPLLVRTPGTLKGDNGGAVADCPTEWFDIGPTLVELAGSTLKHAQFAKSLCPVINVPESEHRCFAISELKGEIMYMDKRWKLLINADGLPYCLFDLEQDPDETHNLVTEESTIQTQKEIRMRIQEHLVRTQVRLGENR